MRTKLSVILLAAICTLAVNTAWAQTTWYPTGLYGGNVVAVNQCSASTGAMYMASTGTGVYRSVDGGLTWSNISAQFGGRYVYCFYSFSPTFFTKATLAGTNDGLFRSDDDGLTWSAVTAIPAGTKCYSIATPGAAYIMVGTSNGIYVTGSYGYVWDHPAAPAASVYCFVTYTMSGQSTNFCGTSNGVYVSPGPYGGSWSELNDTQTSGKSVRGLVTSGSNLLAAVWNGGTGLGVYKSPLASPSWAAMNTGLGNLNVNALAQPILGSGAIAATDNGVSESTDGGASWHDYGSGLPAGAVKCLNYASGGYFCGPTNGGVYKTGAPIVQPVPILPVNNATNVTVPPTLTWSYPVGVPSSYDVQYSTSPTFTSGNVLVSGVPGTATVLNGLPPSTPYYWHVRAVFGALTTGYSTTFKFTTAETPVAPTSPTSILFSTTTPVTTDSITATAGGSTDANAADTVSYQYEWCVSLNSGVTYGDWGFAGATLDAANTVRGQMWKCHARATDGVLFSAWYESPTVLTIADSAPTAPTNIAFNPTSPTVLNDIVATGTGSTDADGDTLVYVYEWAVSKDGGATFGGWVYAGATLPAAATSYNDQWKCHVRASDGALFSPWYESPTYLTIGGAPPSAPTSVILGPAAPVTTDDLTAAADGSVDPSSNPITYHYVWSVSTDNGATWSPWAHPGATLSAVYTSHGDQWKCAVYAQSVGGTSPWFYPTDILTILNSAPSAPTSITFNPPAPAAGVDIAATAVGSVDPDADPLTYEYQWAVSKDGGLTYGPWTVNGTPLSGSATAPKDRWECQARATDGTLFSPWFLSSPVLIVIVPPPTVVSATYVDLTHVDLLFSQDLGLATSQQASNYQVSPALAVSGAVRGADLRTVHLTTGTQTSGTTYTATVSGVQNSLGIPIVKGSGDTALWTTPTAVTAWTPQGSNVPAELPTLTATFSAAMNQATAEDAFTISPAQAGGVTHGWPGAFSWVGNKLQYKLSTSLAKHTTYTVKIAASATSAAGGAMGADKTWTFSTDNLPAVSSYAPTGTAVPLSNTGQVIKIGFNQAMNKAAVQGALWVYPATSTPGSPTRPDGTFSWVGNEMSYTLSSTLAPRTSYTVKLGTGAKSSAGVARATDFVWTFKTNDEPVVILQAPTGTAVPLSTSGKVVRIGFNRAMNKAAVQGALWIYKAASTPTSPTRPAGAFSWVGNEMRYTFTSKLVPLTDYTVKLGTGAKSSTGVNLGNVFEWTFTTSGASTSPGTLTLAAAPTASGAQITLSLASAADVTVTVRNLAGREVAVLSPGTLQAGVQTVLWNGKSRTGTRVPPGTYLVQVRASAADGTTATVLASLQLR